MRVATSTLFNAGLAGLQKHQSDQTRQMQQLSSGRKMLTPSDDPIASAKVLDIGQNSSINQQYATNSGTVDSTLSMTESTLSQVVRVIQDVKTLAVNAGDPTLGADEKKMLDSELQGRYKELLGLANSKDGSGIYLFSGFKGDTQPFSESSFGHVVYDGDEGTRKIQISSGRQIPVSENGKDVFQKFKSGNGTFVATANSANTGSGIVSPGQVVDSSRWAAVSPQDFSIQFYRQPNASNPEKFDVSYDLIDNTTGTSLIDGTADAAARTNGPRTYTEGGDIEFKQLAGEDAVPAWDYGIKMNVSGTPLAADSFSVKASENVDLFSTFGQLSAALNSYNPDASGKGQAAFQNALNGVMQGLDSALSGVLTTQASLGARMVEAQSVQDTNSDLQLQYQAAMSALGDLDYSAAISDFSQTQMVLEATRKSFSSLQDLSLFKYI